MVLYSFVLLIYLFLYIPVGVLVLFSFNPEPMPAPLTVSTVHWYMQLWHEDVLWQSVFTSLTIAIASLLISLSMSLGLVYWHLWTPQFSKNHTLSVHQWATRIIFLFYPNLIVPEVVLGVGLLTLFAALSLPFGMISLIVAHVVLGLGYAVPLVVQRYADIDRRIIEAGYDLGATRWDVFVRIVIPILRPVLIASGLLIFVISFDDFVLSYFCAGAQVQTISLYLLALLRTGVTPVMSAFATIMLLVSGILVLPFCWYTYGQEQA